MRIFIDADGCPVVRLTVSIAKKHHIPVTIVCDTSHDFSGYDAKVITVDKGADSADFKLVNMISAGDIAVTQDYGLAAMCLSKRAHALNQNGIVYTNDNIDSMLMTRHLNKKLICSGKHPKGPKKRTDAQNDSFAEALEELIAKYSQKG
ncbi:MAG: YaiI/YqxD family protein [Ruminococcus albus]|nr:YaiI/YqxD family protein [Ruminococcus albus]